MPLDAQRANLNSSLKRPWDPVFLQRLSSSAEGDVIRFDLLGAEKAAGTIQYVRRKAGELVYVSGELTEPEPGRFFFQRQIRAGSSSLPAVASAKPGEFVGVVEFPGTGTAYRIEPLAPLQPRPSEPPEGYELVKRSLDEVMCVNMPRPSSTVGDILEIPPLNPADFPEVTIPQYQNGIAVLESLHGAAAVIYLDFQGGYTPTWGGVTYERPTLSNSDIRSIWLRVAQDFMPFQINVTTDLRVFQAATEGARQRVIITPTTFKGTEVGGVAYSGSFNWTGDTPCWSFMIGGKACAEVCSHELGHTMGLSHSGWSSGTSSTGYYSGHGTGETGWAPIMGVGYYQNVTQWSKGEYLHADNFEDQLEKLVTVNNQVTYRADDTGEVLANSRYLEVYPDEGAFAEGVIERTGDTDAFQFATGGGAVALRADPLGLGPNLALALSLCDSNDTPLIAVAPEATLGAALGTNLPPGTYTLRVRGSGRGSPSTNGFSNYGSLGYYSVTGSVANARLPDRFSVREHSTNGTVVGTVRPRTSTQDPLRFKIISGNKGNAFAIDNLGVLTVADDRTLDFMELAQGSQFPVQFELFVDIADDLNPSLAETNRRVVVAVLFAAKPPVILRQPESATVAAGCNAAFFVSGGPEQAFFVLLTYQWCVNGTPIPGATSNSFQIPDAQARHAGDYTVLLTNSAGAVTSQAATLTVTPAVPLFTRQPHSQKTPLHCGAAFVASAVGTEPIAWQWQFQGRDLPGKTSPAFSLADAKFSDSGIYRVLASNAVGVVASADAVLDVQGVIAWGANEHGQTDVPAGLSNVVQVSAGARQNLALLRDGRVVAWGSGEQTNVPPGLSNVLSVAAGGSHSLALKRDGTVAAWGDNYEGQCNVPFGLENVVAISAGSNHSLALTGEGKVVGWGDDSAGQCIVWAHLTNLVAISGGGRHNLALSLSASQPSTLDSQLLLLAWGDNSCGQIGVPAGLPPVLAVSAGAAHSLALLTNGSVRGWGGAFSMPNLPLAGIAAVTAGAVHTVALIGDGPPFITEPPLNTTARMNSTAYLTAVATGAFPLSYQWQLDGTNLPGATMPVLAIDSSAGGEYRLLVSNACGAATSTPAVVTIDKRPWIRVHPLSCSVALGSELRLQVVAEGAEPLSYHWYCNGAELPAQTNAALVLNHVSSAQAGECSVLVSNIFGSVTSHSATVSVQQVISWGYNNGGQTDVPRGLSGVVQLAGGVSHSLALKADGTVVGWGRSVNDYGQGRVPAGLTNVVAIAAGWFHSLALKSDGTVVAWGAGSTIGGHPHFGQVRVPVGLSNVVAIAAGGYISAALKDDGQVVLWGQYNFPTPDAEVVGIAAAVSDCAYLLADGTAFDFNSGVGPPPGSDLVAIASRAGLTADGMVVVGPSLLPAPAGLSNVVELAVGDAHVLVRKTDGGIAIWGEPDPYGALVGIPKIGTNTVAVGCGVGHSLVALGDGSLQITLQPCDRKVEAGGNTLFHVLAAGSGPLNYQWRFEDIELPGQTNAWLRLTGLALTNTGGYSAVVSGPSGSVTSRVARLSVRRGSTSLRFAVDAPSLVWGTGVKPWFAETNTAHDRIAAAQSALIGDDQNSYLQTIVTGPGALSFWWKVSSEEPFDTFEFSINGEVKTSIAGEVNWRQEHFALTGGTSTLTWTYAKDAYSSAGWDAAWLDEVRYTTNPPVRVLLQILSASWQPETGFRLLCRNTNSPPLTAEDLARFEVQSSTNLMDWSGARDCLMLKDGDILLFDSRATNGQQYYRILQR